MASSNSNATASASTKLVLVAIGAAAGAVAACAAYEYVRLSRHPRHGDTVKRLGAAVGRDVQHQHENSAFQLRNQIQGQEAETDEAQADISKLAEEGDDIINEQFTRNVQMLGEAGQMAVHRGFVVVVGLGGVGSHAAAMLLRSGVGRLRLVDFDQVSLSSLNRHAVATREDVGTPKADCLCRHFRRILPEARVEAMVAMFTSDTEGQVLDGRPDYVLDCIDNIDTKVALLWACRRRGLRVLSAMGAGARLDPTRIRIADVSDSSVDPLSRAVRVRLRKLLSEEGGSASLVDSEAGDNGKNGEGTRNGSREENVEGSKPEDEGKGEVNSTDPNAQQTRGKGAGGRGKEKRGRAGDDRAGGGGGLGNPVGIEAVFSVERPKSKLLPLAVEDANPADYQLVPGFRVRIIPVLGTIPAMFGQAMATHVVSRLAGLDVPTEPVVTLSAEHFKTLHARLVEREEIRFGSADAVQVDEDDVRYVVREVWGGHSARQLHRYHHHAQQKQQQQEGRVEKHGTATNGTPESSGGAPEVNGCHDDDGRSIATGNSNGHGVGNGACNGSGDGVGDIDRSEGAPSLLTGRAMWRSILMHMTLTRWDKHKPPAVDNLVLLTFDEADEHDATTLADLQGREPDYVRLVTTVLKRGTQAY